jgi:hypothetical protein
MARADNRLAVRTSEHACCRFAHADDRRRIAAAFVSGGLTSGHKVVYFCDREPEDFVAELAAGDDRVEAAIDRGQLDVRSARGVYTPNGRFDVERMLRTARDALDRALAEGYPALRMTAEMSWADRTTPGFERLAEYERRLAELMERADVVAPADVLDAHFHGPLRLDLADLEFVDVAGMRALRGHKGQQLTIAGASPPVRRLLGLLGWDTDPSVQVFVA